MHSAYSSAWACCSELGGELTVLLPGMYFSQARNAPWNIGDWTSISLGPGNHRCHSD